MQKIYFHNNKSVSNNKHKKETFQILEVDTKGVVDINILLNQVRIDKKNEFNEACRLIGIFNENKETLEKRKKASAKVDENFILEKIEARIQARKSGNYKLADKIRDDLLKNGIIIEDKQNKTEWKYK